MIYLNGKPINTTRFPDNTSQVWKLPQWILEETNFANVTWDFQHEGEFMELAQLKQLLDMYGFKTALRIPYLPYARQDKKVSNNTTFALHTFAKLLNSLAFDEVFCVDAHSTVSEELIDNLKVTYTVDEIKHTLRLLDNPHICYPDQGAFGKYIEMKHNDLTKITGIKVRNQSTGVIESYEVIGCHKDKNVLIVDDICDGGATFVHLTKELLTKGAKEVNLFVTHGIFSKGLKPLKEAGIKRIFTRLGEAIEIHGALAYKPWEKL